MFGEGEGGGVVEADDFVDAVGELEAAVFDTDAGLGEGEFGEAGKVGWA